MNDRCHDEPSTPTRSNVAIGALVGVAIAALALGTAELVAGLVSTWRSPVVDVGDRVIDLAPSFVTKFAIDVFGTNDKPALLIGIGMLLALYSAVMGALAFTRRLVIGLGGFALFGLIGVVAVVTKRTDPPVTATTPVVVGTVVGILGLLAAATIVDRSGSARETTSETGETDMEAAHAQDTDESVDRWVPEPEGTRRDLLVRSGATIVVLALVGAAAGGVGRRLRSRFSAAESRASLRLPAADEVLPLAPDAVSVDVDGVSDFFTPNDVFYRIDTVLAVPQLRSEDYELSVTGMVDNPMRLSFDDLISRNVVEHDITLTCVSNPIGGGLVGNARWLGVRLDELLADAGVSPDATQVVGRSVDGYTCGFPVEAATDGRNALVAFGMNGEPLPLEHGFPVRLVVPGLYGYISATKWLTEIELTTFEDFDQFWVPRGYAERAPIKIQSRIDSIDGLGTLVRDADGIAAIGGVAWAQTRGISGVEIKLDDGDWEPAELGAPLNNDTWRQWAYRWEPAATGRVQISSRAIDGTGQVQTPERTDPLPDGATGHHTIVVFIE